MTRSEIAAFNAGVAAVVTLAAASAHAMRAKLVEKPTRYAFAIEALQALAETAAELVLHPPLLNSEEAAGGPSQARESVF